MSLVWSRVKAVIFDMDGVIVDSEEYHLRSYNLAFSELGLKLTENDFKNYFGSSAREIVARIFEKHGIKKNNLEYARIKDEKYREIIKDEIAALPGVLEFISDLKKKYKICVASSSARENVKLVLERLGLIESMEFFVSGDDVTRAKPSPEIYLKAIKKLGFSASECVVIEDADLGVEAAKEAGCGCVAITNTLPAERLDRADVIVDSLEEIDMEVFDRVEIILDDVDSAIRVPGSKSITNRALIMAALADGKSILRNVLYSDDTQYMIEALKKLGIKIEKSANELVVHGGQLSGAEDDIFVGNSGTCMRFLAALGALVGIKLTGDTRMLQRPIDDLIDALTQLGVSAEDEKRCPPVDVKKGFPGGKCKISGKKSSQFLSAVLMVAAYADTDVEIKVDELVSRPFIDITIKMMKDFGVKVENDDYEKFRVKSGQKYEAREYFVETDATNASYFFGMAAVNRGRVKVEGLSKKSIQGDVRFVDVLEKMGCKVEYGNDFITVEGGELKGITIDMNEMPDVVQTLAAVALFAEGRTRIKNVANLRIKETDRLKAMATELGKLGADVIEEDDGLEIEAEDLHSAVIETYNDHRMAMSFAVVGSKVSGLQIMNPKCVNKTFPEFWERVDEL
jgi:3-phosphoshikimate 1-carboxyvinyltransferase